MLGGFPEVYFFQKEKLTSGNLPSGKLSSGKLPFWETVLLGNCPSGKLPNWKKTITNLAWQLRIANDSIDHVEKNH